MKTTLRDMIPPVELAGAYINRHIYGVKDFDLFEGARQSKENLLIKGPTQAAKTLALRAYGASKGIPVITVDVGAAMDPATTLGSYRRNASGELEWFDGLMVAAFRQGDCVIVIDECNMAHPKVMAAFHPMGDARRAIYLAETGEYVKAGPDLLLAATMNPDYIGTTPLGQAFSARFTHIPWDYSDEVEEVLLAPSVRELAAKLRSSDHIRTPVSTHMLMKLQDSVKRWGYTFAIQLFTGNFAPEEKKGLEYAFDAGLDDAIAIELGGTK